MTVNSVSRILIIRRKLWVQMLNFLDCKSSRFIWPKKWNNFVIASETDRSDALNTSLWKLLCYHRKIQDNTYENKDSIKSRVAERKVSGGWTVSSNVMRWLKASQRLWIWKAISGQETFKWVQVGSQAVQYHEDAKWHASGKCEQLLDLGIYDHIGREKMWWVDR